MDAISTVDNKTIDTASWITGLMRENYEAVSFIPEPTIRFRYIAQHRYILQTNEQGKPVGYLLHGAINAGQPVVISQHVIDYDFRLRGYGELAFSELVERCTSSGATSIRLRCADDLQSVLFWQHCGFETDRIVPGGISRGRMINSMIYRLPLSLFVETESGLYLPKGE